MFDAASWFSFNFFLLGVARVLRVVHNARLAYILKPNYPFYNWPLSFYIQLDWLISYPCLASASRGQPVSFAQVPGVPRPSCYKVSKVLFCVATSSGIV
jgi:hypothetical protein